ncbi:MAG TPA: hypothetical protein VLT59_04650 [Steroidobacteraceae bacterium]|nr:hypothetical protein [Steroidobacteraceae bacterium]
MRAEPAALLSTCYGSDDPETTIRLELRALERMAEVLCEYVEQQASQFRDGARTGSRETRLQLAVLAERRQAAENALTSRSSEPAEIRITRLQKIVEALDCSRAFFASLPTSSACRRR